VGIDGGVAEEIVDFFQDMIGDGVLEHVGFVVDFGPIEFEDADEEEFEEAMAAEDVEGELLAAVGEFGAASRFVLDEAGIGQGLDHGSCGSGDYAHGGGEFAHGDDLSPAGALLQIKLLEIVFHGAGRHMWAFPMGIQKGIRQLAD
jgi:hypothetical protein